MTDINIAELRAIAEAAKGIPPYHKPYLEYDPNGPGTCRECGDIWPCDQISKRDKQINNYLSALKNPEVVLGLLDKLEPYEGALQWYAAPFDQFDDMGDRARAALNPTEAKDDRCCQHTLAIHGKDGCLSSGCPCSRLREASDG